MGLDATAIKFFGHVIQLEAGEGDQFDENYEEWAQKLDVLGLDFRCIFAEGEMEAVALFVKASEQIVFAPCIELLEEYKPTVTDMANLSDGMQLLGKDPSEVPAWYLMAEFS